MRKALRIGAAACAAALVAGAAIAANFSWSGLGADNHWETGGNWIVACCPSPSYPSTSNDNATYNYHAGGWGEADLTANRTINILTVKGDLTLGTSGSARTLTATKFSVDAATADIEFYATSDLTIVTN